MGANNKNPSLVEIVLVLPFGLACVIVGPLVIQVLMLTTALVIFVWVWIMVKFASEETRNAVIRAHYPNIQNLAESRKLQNRKKPTNKKGKT